MKPTIQQQTFIDALISTDSNLCLRARAGCGKTSSILMAIDAHTSTPSLSGRSIWVCAYNKAIADEVGAKLKSRGHQWPQVSASTVHSAGMGLLKYIFHPKVDENKVKDLIWSRIDRRLSDYHILDSYFTQVTSLVSKAKQSGFGFFDDCQIGDARAWYDLADHYDINGLDDTTQMDKIVAAAQVIYRESLDRTDVIDFDDMILLPLVKNLKVKYVKDLVFVDEAQDLSRARQALIRKFISPSTGRIVIVGDDKQAIYGFSGADAQALDNLTSQMDATVLPLSVTWRCPKAVVEVAQRIVPDLEAAENAPQGTVSRIATLDGLSSPFKPGREEDAILCRNTAPLINIAYKLIRSGVPCKVEGRSIGEGLINLARRWKVTSTASLTDRLIDYRDREVQKALAKGQELRASEIQDRVETVLQVIAAVNHQGKNRVEDVVQFIEDLFKDGADSVVTLCTYHRSKGREWNRVMLWEHGARCPSKAARQEWQKVQESNLAYVAITRAKNELVFVG